MKLTCYVHDGWHMHIRPASASRAWMEATPERYAYRCLPMTMANAHGWEIYTPAGFWAMWSGGSTAADVQIRTDPDMPAGFAPVSIFGAATITLHTHGIFRTPKDWNLLVTGPMNAPKDGISALSGIIESDWIVMTFTMNWLLTRPGHWVRFDKDEAIAHLMPVKRGAIEEWEPEIVPMRQDPYLMDQFNRWSVSRDSFHARRAHGWQKTYFQGRDMDGREADGHQTKLRVCPFKPVKE